jgi:hypothetical protein
MTIRRKACGQVCQGRRKERKHSSDVDPNLKGSKLYLDLNPKKATNY